MYSWSKDFPTLTELFFGKGNGPQGPLNGMTEKKPEMTVSEQMQEELEPIPSKKESLELSQTGAITSNSTSQN